MTVTSLAEVAPHHIAPGRGGGGPAPTRIVVAYGFWIFLLSDIILFSGLFAAYAVLATATARGPAGTQLFDLTTVFLETMVLLVSSYTCGLMMLSAERQHPHWYYPLAALTFILGAGFVAIEINEFAGMIHEGAGPQRSAFLSAFFTLVGTHGAHVSSGLIWLVYMSAQVAIKGLTPVVLRRLLCFSLFWHALDIVWVGVFTMVYLMGVR